ncbi:hypothetical protein [Natronosalvus amylolyticus]|uniref:hypothetical protein n=1 Tax=Natronosalvus amylolyticus TaxID=2961994 RepID=UPI0020C987E6|nr:hypothetical protein [Natronosalvus amylolyticus]
MTKDTKTNTRARVLSVTLAALLVASLVTFGLGLSSTALADTDADAVCEPERSITYDEFRTDQATVDEANHTGSTDVSKDNTLATIEGGEAFHRVTLENPNSYCVEFELQISEELVTPSTIGTISGSELEGFEDYPTPKAYWESTHSFDQDETYTRITVTMPAESQALFAPSKARVEGLSWIGEGAAAAEGLQDRLVSSLGFGSDLETREYTLEGNDSETVTIDLVNPQTGEPLEDWHATYTVDGSHDIPLDSGSDEPVYYRELTDDDGDVTAIEITFNEAAELEFTADPRVRDTLSYDLTSFEADLRALMGSINLPFMVVGEPTTMPLPTLTDVTTGFEVSP